MKKKEVILNSFSSDENNFNSENNTQNVPTMRFNAIEYSEMESARTPRTRSGAASRTTGSGRPRRRRRKSLLNRIKNSAFFSNMTKKKKIVLLIASVLILALLIGSCKFLFMLGDPLIGGDIEEDIRKAQDAVKNDMVSVLLVGADGGGYNTDTIMLAILNCKKNEISLISIPRDTRVPNPYGGSGYAKINSVHTAKGMAGLISQVKAVTGIPVNFYAMINFEGFREAIDILGGVEYNVPQRMKYYDPVQNLNIDLYPGLQVLDGDKAEQLVRCRSIYAMADLARTEVQRDFIKATIEQHATAANLTKLSELYKAMSPYVKTSITLGDALKYAASVINVKSDRIYSYMLPGAAGSYGSQNISYFIYNADEMKKLAEEVGYGDTEIVRLPAPTKSNPATIKTPAKSEESSSSENTSNAESSESTSSESEEEKNSENAESSNTTSEEKTEESTDSTNNTTSSTTNSESSSNSGTGNSSTNSTESSSSTTNNANNNTGDSTTTESSNNTGSSTTSSSSAGSSSSTTSSSSAGSGSDLQVLPDNLMPPTSQPTAPPPNVSPTPAATGGM